MYEIIYCFVAIPLLGLTAVYSWDKGMDLLVPMHPKYRGQ